MRTEEFSRSLPSCSPYSGAINWLNMTLMTDVYLYHLIATDDETTPTRDNMSSNSAAIFEGEMGLPPGSLQSSSRQRSLSSILDTNEDDKLYNREITEADLEVIHHKSGARALRDTGVLTEMGGRHQQSRLSARGGLAVLPSVLDSEDTWGMRTQSSSGLLARRRSLPSSFDDIGTI